MIWYVGGWELEEWYIVVSTARQDMQNPKLCRRIIYSGDDDEIYYQIRQRDLISGLEIEEKKTRKKGEGVSSYNDRAPASCLSKQNPQNKRRSQ